MTTADQIAADLRDAFRGIDPPDLKGSLTFTRADVAVRNAIQAAYQANDFDSAMSRALAAIVALDDAEAAVAAEVEAAQARQKIVTEAGAKAREALRAAMVACGGPGVATVKSGHHKAYLKEGGTKAEITDEDALPATYWRTKKEPARDLIKATLARKKPVPGAALVQSPPSLVISSKDR
ncbi:MAG: siphovirus Gp157 family protein [Pseudomonadota bacterium]|jgi:topoisomerase IA-like protein